MTAAERRVRELERRLHAAGKRFADAARELAPLADELAALEAEHRAALHQAGRHHYLPPARELAADVVLGACRALRPFVADVTTESAERSAEALTPPRPKRRPARPA